MYVILSYFYSTRDNVRVCISAVLVVCAAFCHLGINAAEVLVEAESFEEPGGWVLDPQFIDIMGSGYLLAHGLGKPVSNAKTTVSFPETGTYAVWVRTKDWVAEPQWAPGKFKVVIDGKPMESVFGVQGDGKWGWQSGGSVEITEAEVTLELKDLTGFDGRCDAILFSTDMMLVPVTEPGRKMRAWRKELLGLPEEPPNAGTFDVVIVGGGISGCSAALSAARLGCKVALVQNRPVFGGNNSSEITVRGFRWGKPAPHVTREVYDRIRFSKLIAQRRKVMTAEENITCFLGWHVFAAQTAGGKITSVDAVNTQSSQEIRFKAPVFIDCTGDGSVGFLAGADYRYGRESKAQSKEPLAPETPDRMVLGATLHWKSKETGKASTFPDVSWAEAISKGVAATGGGWQWEYGHHRDMINEAEEIRDYLFRSIYGAFATAKRNEPEKLANHELKHVVYILGKRESRRLMGDYIMTWMDCWETTTKPDRIAVSNNPFDIHVPRKGCDFQIVVDERFGGLGKRKDADIPFRSLYSRNVSNLLMAGRCISVTHIAHSSTRVMNTGGQTGVAAGAAAYLCVQYNTTPRQVGKKHINELQDIVFGKGKYFDALKPGNNRQNNE